MTTGLKEIVGENELNREQRGITATRIFVYDPDDTTSNDTLPKLGDIYRDPEYLLDVTMPSNVWGATPYRNLTCRKITRHPISNDKTKIRWDVYYSNEPTDMGQFADPSFGASISTNYNNLPLQMEHAGEFIVIKPTTNNPQIGWQWKDNGTTVNQPLSFKVGQNTLRVTIVLLDSTYNNFLDKCRSLLGKVNDEDMSTADDQNFTVMKGKKGSWLFNSVSTEIFRDYSDVKKWQAEMLFTYRNPDSAEDDTDGWSKVLRVSDATWQVPVKSSDGTTLYQYGDFALLFANAVTV